MNRVWLAVGIVLAACGYDRPADVPWDGSNLPDDAAIDAPTDGPEIDAPSNNLRDPCDPFEQDTCNGANPRCAWFNSTTGTGASGCAPEGTRTLGQTCTTVDDSHGDCVSGTECVDGRCGTICASPAAPCGANYACIRYAGVFETEQAGVCIERCDPLTQSTLVTSQVACGSPAPASPTRGCYGIEEFSCAPVPSAAASLTDRMPAFGMGGNVYVNGCAPGYTPLLFESTGSSTIVCTGICAPAKTDNTMPANVRGNPAVSAKLHNAAASAVGDGVCVSGKKGSLPASGNQNCIHAWFFAPDQMNPPPAFANLGFCFAPANYTYDHDMNQGTPPQPYPSCHTLPPGPTPPSGCTCDLNGVCSGSTCPNGLASQWGCYTRADSMVMTSGPRPARPPFAGAFRAPSGSVPLVRHRFD